MLTKRLAILVLFAGWSAFGQQPAASPSNSAIPMRHHGITRLNRAPGTSYTYYASSYSAGFAVTGGPFREVLGSWIAPKVNCAKTPNAYSSFLVGLDGFGNEAMEGLGTEADCMDSSPVYYAWYEFPTGTRLISGITVSPGDRMSATVVCKGTKFTLKMTNHTTGQTFKHTETYSAQRNNAVWIVETPCCDKNGKPSPLADFGTAYFGHVYTSVKHTDWAVNPDVTGPIGDFDPVYFISMVDPDHSAKAEPSFLDASGSSFDVLWEKSK